MNAMQTLDAVAKNAAKIMIMQREMVSRRDRQRKNRDMQMENDRSEQINVQIEIVLLLVLLPGGLNQEPAKEKRKSMFIWMFIIPDTRATKDP